MTLRSLAALAAGLFAAGLAASAAAAPFKTSFGPTTTDISTGHAAHSSIPAAMGYWKDENLEVNVFGAAGAAAGLQLLVSGNIDFITLVTDELMVAQAKGIPVTGVYVHARHPINEFVVLKGSVGKLAELKGKTIGAPVVDANPYVRGLLAESGIDMDKDIKIVGTGTGAPAALALQRGDIAAWASWDTAVAALVNRGLEFQEFRPSYYDELLGNVIVTRNDMIEKHPEVVIGMARGIAKAVEFGTANADAAVKIHWKVYPQTKPQGDEATLLPPAKRVFVSRFSRYELDPGMQYGAAKPEQWKRAADFMKESGALPASYDPASAFTDKFIAEINKFDRAAVAAQAKAWKE